MPISFMVDTIFSSSKNDEIMFKHGLSHRKSCFINCITKFTLASQNYKKKVHFFLENFEIYMYTKKGGIISL